MTSTSAARPVLNGRYELHRRIARGGMADVFLAKDQLLDRPVAVKVLFPQYAADPTFVARFRREAQSAANLNHPSIVSVYDWGEHDGTYFIVMEYVEGQTLADVIANQGPLDAHRAAGIATEVAVALGFAHRNGTVHRDVKPGNIMINQQGQIKVADFGIARAFGGSDDELTQTGSVMGTASYFSPEQAQGKTVDPRSDLYSLGVVLFEMVVGQTPFTGNTPVAIAYKHVQEHPPRAASLNPRVPAAMDAMINRLLAKDPAMRYPAAEEVRADLTRFREGQPLVGIGQAAAGQTVAYNGAAATMAGGPMAFPQTDSTMIMAETGGMTAARGPDTGSSRAIIDTSRAMPASAAVTQVEPVEEYYDPPSRTGVFVIMLGVLLVGLVGLIWWLSGRAGDDTTDDDVVADVVQIPTLIGENIIAASNELTDLGLVVETSFEEAPDAEPNSVIAQNPEAGSEVERGSTVQLVGAQPEDTVRIPNVINMTLDEAQDALREVGLRSDIRRDWDDVIPEGSIIATNPEVNSEVPVDFMVELLVSQGPEELSIPNIVGRGASEATNAMNEAGFVNFSFTDEGSAEIPQGQVIRTEPAIGTAVSLDSPITIFISLGAQETQVPNIIGKDQAAATEWLSGQQLVPDFQTADLVQGDPNIGLVVGVEPGVGSTLRQGDTVVVYIGVQGQETTTTSSSTTTTQPTSTTTTTEATTTTTEAEGGGDGGGGDDG